MASSVICSKMEFVQSARQQLSSMADCEGDHSNIHSYPQTAMVSNLQLCCGICCKCMVATLLLNLICVLCRCV